MCNPIVIFLVWLSIPFWVKVLCPSRSEIEEIVERMPRTGGGH